MADLLAAVFEMFGEIILDLALHGIAWLVDT
jgi:hypothetical protein